MSRFKGLSRSLLKRSLAGGGALLLAATMSGVAHAGTGDAGNSAGVTAANGDVMLPYHVDVPRGGDEGEEGEVLPEEALCTAFDQDKGRDREKGKEERGHDKDRGKRKPVKFVGFTDDNGDLFIVSVHFGEKHEPQANLPEKIPTPGFVVACQLNVEESPFKRQGHKPKPQQPEKPTLGLQEHAKKGDDFLHVTILTEDDIVWESTCRVEEDGVIEEGHCSRFEKIVKIKDHGQHPDPAPQS